MIVLRLCFHFQLSNGYHLIRPSLHRHSFIMADLTVLISPTPLPKSNSFGRFTRSNDSPVSRPIMVTLEMVDNSTSAPSSPINRNFNQALLSPPRNTFKSRPKNHLSSPRRPASAPPQRTSFGDDLSGIEDSTGSSRTLLERKILSSFASTNTKGGELIRPAPPLCEYLLPIQDVMLFSQFI